MGHIFISYSHTDANYAQKLALALQGRHLDVWIDERLDYGSQWPFEIQKQLDSCSAFILIMSPRSFASDWVQSELQRAKRKKKPIFPLLLEGDEPWLSVESTQYYDVRGAVLPDQKFFSALHHAAGSPGAAFVPPMGTGGNGSSSRKVSGIRPVYAVAIVGVVVTMLAIVVPLLLKNKPSAPATAAPSIVTPSASNLVPSDIQVVKADPAVVPTYTEEYPLPNCGGTSELQQNLSTQTTVKKNLKLGGMTSLTGGISAPMVPAVQAKLEAQISATYSDERAQENSVLYSIVLRAAPKSHVVYVIQWTDKKFISTVSYNLGPERYGTEYEYVLSVPMISGSREIVCGGTPNTTEPPPADPTVTPVPVAAPEELAFVSDRDQSIGDFRAFVIDPNNPDPGNYQPFSANPPGVQRVFWPSFCGSRLAVEAQGNPQWIFFLDRGMAPTQWALSGEIAIALGQPHCSPDGRYLSYSAQNQSTKKWDLLIVADIARSSYLYSIPQTNIVSRASWPRSMNSMLFPVLSSSGGSTWSFYVMKNFGSASYDNQILNLKGVSPSISPDGRQVAYYCPNKPDNQAAPLCIADIDGGMPRVLVTTNKRDDKINFPVWISVVTPVWSSDGQWIYYMDYDGGDYDIFRIPSAGGTSENITRAWPSNEIMPATR